MKKNTVDYIEIKNMVINAIENNELDFYPVEYKRWRGEVRSKVSVSIDFEDHYLSIETDNSYKFYDWDEIEDAFCDSDFTTSEILEMMDNWDTDFYITRNEDEFGFNGYGRYFYASDKFIEEVVNLLINDLIRTRNMNLTEWEDLNTNIG